MAQLNLSQDVSCYELLDSSKIFLNKAVSAFIDFTDKTELDGQDVAARFAANGLDEKDIVLPVFSKIERVKDSALCGRNLNHASFPGLLSVDECGLQENSMLTAISLDSIKRIGKAGFMDCKCLLSVSIGSSIQEIADDAFSRSDPFDSQSIESLTIDRMSSEVLGAETGFGLADRSVIHYTVPELPKEPEMPEMSGQLCAAVGVRRFRLNDSGQAYWSTALSDVVDLTQHKVVERTYVDAFPTRDFVVEFSNELLSVGASAFAETNVARGTLPETLLSVADSAFAGCTRYVPDLEDSKLRYIGQSAFARSGVRHASFSQLDQLCANAFAGSQLQTVVFENAIKQIGQNAFPAQTSAYFIQPRQVLRTFANYPWGLQAPNIFAPEMANVPSSLTLAQEHLTKAAVEEEAIAHYTEASVLTSLAIQSTCKTIAVDAFSSCTNAISAFFEDRNINQVKAMGQIPFGLKSTSFIYPEKDVVDKNVLLLHSTTVDKNAVDQALLEQGLTKDQVLTVTFDYRCLSVSNGAFTGFSNVTDAVFESMNILDVGSSALAQMLALSSAHFADCEDYMVRSMPGHPFGISRSKVSCGRHIGKSQQRAVTIWLDDAEVTQQTVQDAIYKSGNGVADADNLFFAFTPKCKSIASKAFAGFSYCIVEVHNSITSIAADAFDENSYPEFAVPENLLSAMPGWPFGATSYYNMDWQLDLSRYSRLTQADFIAEYEQQHKSNGSFSLKFSNSLSDIGPSCFAIPNSAGGIKRYDVYNVILPDSVQHVGEHAFDSFNELTVMYCPATAIDSYEQDGVKHIDLGGASNSYYSICLPNVQHLDGTLATNCDSLCEFYAPKLSSWTVEEGTDQAFFYGCPIGTFHAPGLKLLNSDQILRYNPDDSKHQHKTLQAIEVEDAESIGSYVEDETSEQMPVRYVRAPHLLTSYGWSFNKSMLKSLDLPLLKHVEGYYDCTALTGVHLPEVETVGTYAFGNCIKLEEAYMPKAKELADEAFCNCSSLLCIDLPEASQLGQNAFGGCTSLKKVRVKNNITISMLRRQPNFPWGIADESKFVVQHDVSYDMILSAETVDRAAVDAWTYEWNNDIASIVSLRFASSCRRIECGAFDGFSGLSSVIVPATIESVGRTAFSNCSNLTALTFAGRTWEQMEAMPGFPFGLPFSRLRASTARPQNKTSLVLGADMRTCSVNDGKVVVQMPAYAVIDATGLSTIDAASVDKELAKNGLVRGTDFKIVACLSDDATDVAAAAFAGLSGLNYVDFVNSRNNITSIQKDSFKDCNVISSFMFDSWSMHDLAICSAYPFGLHDDTCLSAADMADVTVVDSPISCTHTQLSDCTFILARKGCTYINGIETYNKKETHLPKLSTVVCKWPCRINAYAFYNCSALTEIDFPEVTSINYCAFHYANGYKLWSEYPKLSSVNLPKCVAIEPEAFAYQASIEELYLPKVERIGYSAFHSIHGSTDGYLHTNKLRSINAPKLRRIGNMAFCNCANLSSISMPELEHPGDSYMIFGIDNPAAGVIHDTPQLREVSFPKLKYLAQDMFFRQTALTSIVAPKLEEVSLNAVTYTGLTSFDCTGLTLYDSAFAKADNLVSVNLANASFGSYNVPGQSVFSDCTKLKHANMLNVTMLPNNAFYNCPSLTNVTVDMSKITQHYGTPFGINDGYNDYVAPFAKTIKYLDMPVLVGPTEYNSSSNPHKYEVGSKFTCYENLISASLPQLTCATWHDFYGLKSFVSAYMPNCKRIEEGAFAYTGITDFYVPRSVTSIAKDDSGYDSPFAGCTKLSDLHVEAGNTCFFSDIDGKHYPAIFKWTSLSDHSQGFELHVATSRLSSLPEGLSKLSRDDLQRMQSLTSLHIPASLTSDLYNLQDLTALQQVTVAPGNPRYSDNNGCNVVIEVSSHHLVAGCASSYLCGDIEVIESYAFANRAGLTSLICEDPTLSVLHEIQTQAFDSCKDLKLLKIACPTPSAAKLSVGWKAIANNKALLSIQLANVSAVAGNAYYSTFEGCDYLEHIEIDGLSAIPQSLCKGCVYLATAKFDGIQEVGKNAFSNCYSLSAASFGSQLTAIRDDAFSGCHKLAQLDGVDYNSIASVGTGAFKDTAFERAEFSQLTHAPDYMFAGSRVSAISMPKLQTVGVSAFSGCRLAEVSHAQIEWLDRGAFASNYALTSVQLPSLTGIASTYSDGAFAHCSSLARIELPHLKAFNGFSYSCLSTVVAPEASSIGSYAFNECRQLVSVDASRVEEVNSNAFDNCVNLTSISLPAAKSFIGEYQFNECISLASAYLPALLNINSNAFYGCKALTALELSSVQHIDSQAFYGSSIRELTLPSCLTYLHYNAFNEAQMTFDEQKNTYRVYYYSKRCPDLSSVWFKGRPYSHIISEIDRGDEYKPHSYSAGIPYIYASGVLYWGIDRKFIKLDTKYMSILKLASGVKCYRLADGGIMYSIVPVLDLTEAEFKKMLTTPFYIVSDIDNTLTWTSVNGVKLNWSLNEDLTDSHELPTDTTTQISMPAGKKLYLFCKEDQPTFYINDSTHCQINCASAFYAGGNACFLTEALCYKKTEFQPTCRNDNQFRMLFNSSNVADASSMALGFQILARYCYAGMFSNCKSLADAPQLPGAILAYNCYAGMFSGCTSLADVHALPATTLADGCYYNMFSECTSLTAAPQLPATTLARQCYQNMFSKCTSLTDAPQLPATTLSAECYAGMFNGCTSLTAAPQLQATTLASYCYCNMFYGCTSLVKVPQLPAMALASYCYASMFNGCTAIVAAPQLPAMTLAVNCYAGMFSDCTSLSSVQQFPAATLANGCCFRMFSHCTSLSTVPQLPATALTDYCYKEMFWGCSALTATPQMHATTLAKNCCECMFLNCDSLVSATKLPATTLAVNCYLNMFSGCNSLVLAPQLPATTLADGCYKSMFSYCTSLSTAPQLPATTLSGWCYSNMFSGCKSLTDAPQLPATTLAVGCYSGMFSGCKSLANAPQLPATTLADSCYYAMFSGCTSLANAPQLPATTLASYCYYNMFSDCTSLTAAPQLPAITLADYCYKNMFQNCSVLVDAPQMHATTLAKNCCEYMFNNCVSLNVAPQLPAMTLADYCYMFMFNRCTSLVAAPQLPATTLASSCYDSMFLRCEALATAPQLPATTLTRSCYYQMFCRCISLKSAPALPATTLAHQCYSNMFVNCTKVTDLHFPKALESDSTFLEMDDAPKFGATNAVVQYDL